jgi:hypothetical protein
VPQAGTSNYAIQVRLFTDFNRVPQVIVMHDLMKMEIDSLQNVLINEDAKP